MDSNKFFSRTYKWVTIALCLTMFVSIFVASSNFMADLIVGNKMIFLLLLIIEIIMVRNLSKNLKNMSTQDALVGLMLYALMNGLTLSVIFLFYNPVVIAQTLLLVVVMFLIMTVIGNKTKNDLQKVKTQLTIGIIVLIIGMLISFFIKSSILDMIITVAGILLFLVLTIYDTQKMKKVANLYPIESEDSERESVKCALELYLDFINLLLFFLGLNRK